MMSRAGFRAMVSANFTGGRSWNMKSHFQRSDGFDACSQCRAATGRLKLASAMPASAGSPGSAAAMSARMSSAEPNVQQDILETFIDRGQLCQLAQPTVLPGGKRIPGLKLDHPRQLALMHALVRFAHVAAGATFTTAELYPQVIDALGCSTSDYTLASLRYDLSKLRAKRLVEKLPHSRRYRLLPSGYSVSLVFLKLFERIYAPLTAGLLRPVAGDRKLEQQRRSQIDRLYQRVVDDLGKLMQALGLRTAA